MTQYRAVFDATVAFGSGGEVSARGFRALPACLGR
jgi:hypothetical protein